jgi:hypothetical protein
VVLEYQTRGEIAKQLVSQTPQNEFRQQVVAQITLAKYALSDIHKPMGVSEYQLTQSLPDNLRPSLPSIEEIERELAGVDDE